MFRLGAVVVCSVVSCFCVAQNVDLLGHLPYSQRLSDVWGYTDTAGIEYALVGVYDGTSIVDISTDSAQPTEIFFIPGPNSTWRDIKTWKDRAYITNENSGGLLIVDLSDLPNSIDTFYYSVDTLAQDTVYRSHNIFIDESGFAYLLGSNAGTRILDLNPNPDSPRFVGRYDEHYVHDAFVRGDTLWAAEIVDGLLTAIDVSDKANPTVIGSVNTPHGATHNCWVSSDGRYAFTTGERSGAPVSSIDVSDVTDMVVQDEMFSNPGSGVIPHNTYWLDSFLVTSWYKDGVIIADASKPDNLVITGGYDTSPFPSEDGFRGCWGVYPYFPSGRIAATDIHEGLFVLGPTYQRACYLEGMLTEATTSFPISAAAVELINTTVRDSSNILGEYKTGIVNQGLYDVRFSHPNCQTVIVQDVLLQSGQITTLNMQLDCPNLSIDDLNSSIFSFYSAHQSLHWQTSSPSTLQVFSLNGQQIVSTPVLPKGTLQLGEDLASGMYLAVLKSDSFMKTIRIVR